MLILCQYGVPVNVEEKGKNGVTHARFESWRDLLQNWTRFLGHGDVPGPLSVTKGVLGKVLVKGTKADVIAFARDQHEAEQETGYYRTEGSRRAARNRGMNHKFQAWPAHVAAALA